MKQTKQDWTALLGEHLEDNDIVRLILSNRRRKSDPYRKLVLRPLQLQGKPAYQCEFHSDSKVTHQNLAPDDVPAFVEEKIRSEFKQLNLYTAGEDVEVRAAHADRPRMLRRRAQHRGSEQNLYHNRRKQYLIPADEPCDFLIRLGVMAADGSVIPKRYSKFRQINRYLEILRDILPALPEGKLRVLDFGCGKAYLTFALYHYLHSVCSREVSVTGLDLKDDVIRFCNDTARALHYDDLHFERGDIADYEGGGVDLVVTLHACDTATDYALINAVRWGASVILSVPCCQHELFRQIENPTLEPVLRHGILRDRFTELLTDGIRGLKLEAAGYETAMIEFTSLEHTARNIMIKAVRRRSPAAPASRRAARQYADLCAAYHLRPTIDRLQSGRTDDAAPD
jgi:SAM-dependent methyltransferase